MPSSAPIQSEEPGLQADQRLVDRGWLRIGAGAAVAGQAMVFSFAINLSEISGWAYATVHGILIASSVLTFAFLGRDLASASWTSLCDRRISIDLLFLITLLGAFTGSLVSTLTGVGSVYYEVVAILIVVHTAGKMLGAKSRVNALRAVEEAREKFESCRVIGNDGSVATVPSASLAPGSRIAVAPGEAISVDGEIASGRGYVQETSMTGEWRPASKGPGEKVWAGTFSVDGSFELRAAGGRRRIDDVLEGVRNAQLTPSRLQQQADRLMTWFLPLVVVVSVSTFLFWNRTGPWDRALFNSMAVLLVACPCAMGLATPIAVWAGLARMAEFGLVARTGDFIDVLSRADTLLIDKTGTLSESSLVIREWIFTKGQSWPESLVKSLAGIAEEGLPHPVAKAFSDECHVLRDTFAEGLSLEHRTIVPGLGVRAVVRDSRGNFYQIAVGELELGEHGASKTIGNPPTSPQIPAGECHVLRDTSCKKAVHVFVDGKCAATVVLEERWRNGLREGLHRLQTLNMHVEVLSGDPDAEKSLLGLVAVRAGLTPAQKRERVAQLIANGATVLYLGDGINDAEAMCLAHGSIVMQGGAGLARASAMAVFAGNDLRFLPQAIGLARHVRTRIRTNLCFAAGYNIAGMILAAAGWLHPVAAALLMLGSSVFVSIVALRGLRRDANFMPAGQ